MHWEIPRSPTCCPLLISHSWPFPAVTQRQDGTEHCFSHALSPGRALRRALTSRGGMEMHSRMGHRLGGTSSCAAGGCRRYLAAPELCGCCVVPFSPCHCCVGSCRLQPHGVRLLVGRTVKHCDPTAGHEEVMGELGLNDISATMYSPPAEIDNFIFREWGSAK